MCKNNVQFIVQVLSFRNNKKYLPQQISIISSFSKYYTRHRYHLPPHLRSSKQGYIGTNNLGSSKGHRPLHYCTMRALWCWQNNSSCRTTTSRSLPRTLARFQCRLGQGRLRSSKGKIHIRTKNLQETSIRTNFFHFRSSTSRYIIR